MACGFGRKILPKRWASCLMSPMGLELAPKKGIDLWLSDSTTWLNRAPDSTRYETPSVSRCCAICFGVGCNGRSMGHHLLVRWHTWSLKNILGTSTEWSLMFSSSSQSTVWTHSGMRSEQWRWPQSCKIMENYNRVCIYTVSSFYIHIITNNTTPVPEIRKLCIQNHPSLHHTLPPEDIWYIWTYIAGIMKSWYLI